MKKKLTRIWGIGLTFVIAASMLLFAAPVSAGTLSWGVEDPPDELESGSQIYDLDVSGDGEVIYVVIGGNETWRSTNEGEGWSKATIIDGTTVLQDAEFVAVAPDDPNYIAACNSTDTEVFISDDAGANWDTLGAPGVVNTWDLAMSVEKGGRHFVAVAGDDGAGGAELWTYEIGAIGANWEDAHNDTGFAGVDATAAVEFSPNFYSDQTMVAVTFDNAGDEINFETYSFNTNNWNAGAFPSETDLVQDNETITTLDRASIALAPDYLGSDDSLRIAFVGLAVDGGSTMQSEGIFRLDDDDVEVIRDEKAIHSIAFDGTLLVAGRYDNPGVYRSTDALSGDPSSSGSTGTKSPGGTGMCSVGIAGDLVVAGTMGANSAFAFSEDNGATFNGLSIIDTELDNFDDVLVNPDGSELFLATRTAGNELSVWRYASRWERIYTNDTVTGDYIMRLAPDDEDTIYLAEIGGTQMYYSSDGGDGKWHTRIYKETTGVVDMAIEGDGDTIYILTTNGYVSKSTNRGFTWGSKKSSKLSGGADTIVVVDEDEVVVAGDGGASYTEDGNSTWTKLTDGGPPGALQVVATGVDDGDFIFIGTDDPANHIYRWEIGDDDEWDDIFTTPAGHMVYGLAMEQGVLYAVSATGGGVSKSYRSLDPTGSDPSFDTINEGDTVDFDAVPANLKVSRSGETTKLWTLGDTPDIYSFKDTLATVATELGIPATDATVAVNHVSGRAHVITFTWISPSDGIDEYDLQVALDSSFDQIVDTDVVADDSDEGEIISQVAGPSADFDIEFMPGDTYYWRVRVRGGEPVKSGWSEVRSFTVEELPEQLPPVIVEQPGPPPTIEVPPTPEIVITPPEIVLPPPQAAPEIVIPAAPPPAPPAIPAWAIYAIIIIGAILVIALIVLIMRTRRPV